MVEPGSVVQGLYSLIAICPPLANPMPNGQCTSLAAQIPIPVRVTGFPPRFVIPPRAGFPSTRA